MARDTSESAALDKKVLGVIKQKGKKNGVAFADIEAAVGGAAQAPAIRRSLARLKKAAAITGDGPKRLYRYFPKGV